MAAPDPYLQPPLALFTDARLTDGDRTVYCLLTSFGDHGTLTNCRPSVSTIAKRGGRSRRAVVENLKHLAESGWILRTGRVDEQGDKDTTLYSFPFHRVVTETALPSAPNCPTVVTETALRVVTQTALGVVTETAHNLEPFTKSHSPRDIPARGKPEQAGLPGVEPEAKASPRQRAKRQPTESSVQFHSVWDHWERLMIPAKQVDEKPDPRKWKPILAALAKHGLDELAQIMAWHAGELQRRPPYRPWAIEGWCSEAALKATAQSWRNDQSGQVASTNPNRLQGQTPKELPKWN